MWNRVGKKDRFPFRSTHATQRGHRVRLVNNGRYDYVGLDIKLLEVFRSPHWPDHPQEICRFFGRGSIDRYASPELAKIKASPHGSRGGGCR